MTLQHVIEISMYDIILFLNDAWQSPLLLSSSLLQVLKETNNVLSFPIKATIIQIHCHFGGLSHLQNWFKIPTWDSLFLCSSFYHIPKNWAKRQLESVFSEHFHFFFVSKTFLSSHKGDMQSSPLITILAGSLKLVRNVRSCYKRFMTFCNR